jgi:hypothetical protein
MLCISNLDGFILSCQYLAHDVLHKWNRRKHTMKETIFLTVLQNGAKRIPMGLGVTLALTFLNHNASASPEVNLGTAYSFGVLAGSAVTSTGPTVISGGYVGLYPGTLSSVSGFPPGTVNSPYSIQANNAVTGNAQSDLSTAFGTAAGLAPTGGDLTGQNLGGLTLLPGVYKFDSSAFLTGTLTLNDLGNPDAVFVFQIGSTLITASGSSVRTINDPDAGAAVPGVSVFWQVGSSATLGTGTDFEGNILAYASITDDGGSTVDGRLLAENAAVTLNDTVINVPLPEQTETGLQPGELPGGLDVSVPDNCSTLLLLGSGLAALFAFGRRFSVLPGKPA